MQLLGTWVTRQFILCCVFVFLHLVCFMCGKSAFNEIQLYKFEMRCIIKAGAFHFSRWPWTIFSINVAFSFIHTFGPIKPISFHCARFVLGLGAFFSLVVMCLWARPLKMTTKQWLITEISTSHTVLTRSAKYYTHKHTWWPIMDTEQHNFYCV